jgi:spore germination cell wall hydrolase CwlJ-like protein
MRYMMLVLMSLVLISLTIPTNASHRENRKEKEKEFNCIVEAVYFEARGEPSIGQRAVVFVILNRMVHKSFPNTACAVVKQGRYWRGYPVRNMCHFSYYCDGRSETIDQSVAYATVKLVVLDAMRIWTKTNVLYYHNTKVTPYWQRKFKRMFKIGNHIFYGEQND